MKIATQNQKCMALVALVLATLFWAGNFIVGRWIREDIEPLELNVIRWGLCLVTLLPFTLNGIIAHRRELLASWQKIVLLGLTGIAAFHTMVYEALSLTQAVNCLLILALAPVITLVGGMVWNGFRATPVQLLGILVSFIGAIILLLSGRQESTSLFQIDSGKLWMIGAVLIWAWYTLLLREKISCVPQTVTLVASITVGVLAMLFVQLFRSIEVPQINGETVLAILYIAIFASALGFLLWSYGISVIGPEAGGQFVHLMPIFGSILAIIFLNEDISVSLFAGAACVVVGIILVNRE
ncbi:DMT family transporter [Kiloniella litopenaei]|uniref:DMT family transporter n=1 Tax=Kiloniella litopenaei TaxID=1549748 RepID=UPI003BA88FEE